MQDNKRPSDWEQNRIKWILRKYADMIAKTQRGAMAYKNPKSGSELIDRLKILGDLLPTNKRLEKFEKKTANQASDIRRSLAESSAILEIEAVLGEKMTDEWRKQIRALGDNIAKNIAQGRGNADAAQTGLRETEGLDFGIGARPERDDMNIPKSQREIREEREFRERVEEKGGIPPFRDDDDRNPADINVGVPDPRPQSTETPYVFPDQDQNPADWEAGMPDGRPLPPEEKEPQYTIEYDGPEDDAKPTVPANPDNRNPADMQQGIPDNRPQHGAHPPVDPGETRNPADRLDGIPDNKPQGSGSDSPSVSAPSEGNEPTVVAAADTASSLNAVDGAANSFISREESERIHKAITAELEPAQEVSLKRPEALTEGEIRRIVRSPDYGTPGNPDFNRLNDLVQDWHERHYSTGPLKFDGTGKMIRPDFIRQPPKQEIALTTVQEEPMPKAREHLAKRLIETAEAEGGPPTIRALQRGLNLAEKAKRQQAPHSGHGAPISRHDAPRKPTETSGATLEPPLKTDGVLGPKTKLRVDRELAARGRSKVEETAGLGRLASLFDNPRTLRDPQTVNRAVGQSLKPLFGAATDGAPHPIVAEVVQEAVNDSLAGLSDLPGVRRRAPGALRLDGRIGPKTTDALKTALAADGPEQFATRLAGKLGFFG